MMDRAKAIEKIKKCLRLARSSNPHEAAAALRQAQALMREHAVEMADVHASEASESRANSRAKQNPVLWEVGLVNMIARCFACDVIFRSTWMDRHGEYAFIGVGPNPEIASYAFMVLLRQARKARAEHIRIELQRCGPASKTRRADGFCRGWIVAVEPKAMQLVLSEQDAAAIRAYKEKHYPETIKRAGNDRGRCRSNDLERGFDEGKKARLDRGVSGIAPTALLEERT